MTTRPYVIVGAGAIGGTIAHALARRGHDVTLVDAHEAHVQAIRDKGLVIRRVEHERAADDTVTGLRAFTPDEYPDHEPIETALVAVKSQHTRDAAQWLSTRLSASGYAVSVQNGVNEPVLADGLGRERVLGAFVNIFADWEEPGVIRYGGPGALAVGLPDQGVPDGRVLRVARDLRAYGPVTSTANLRGYRWGKRAFGAILGLATLVDAPLADVVDRYPDLAFLVASEPTDVAIHEGIVLESFDAYEPYAFQSATPEDVRTAAIARLASWLRTQPKDRSGVYRDIAVRRRATERGLVSDGYEDLAARHGVSIAFGREVQRRIAAISSGDAAFGWRHLDELRERPLLA
ncbi:FAD-dependent oxidoreductase [Microbacterium betulae]|uniref:FAD-dependent oxidoreductase n=1 Tax=Microbacterium betulae TaxID=2981139 RepID=A0AA97FIH5_9MICO|nr:FAD-dependent oxidoreductase [Microbacterium sp. AB]WOF22910.1 FAD-dependent oxidoreductase [Microbacterium sp. AB]